MQEEELLLISEFVLGQKVLAKHFKICHISYRYTKTQSCFFHFPFRATLLFPLINAQVYVLSWDSTPASLASEVVECKSEEINLSLIVFKRIIPKMNNELGHRYVLLF